MATRILLIIMISMIMTTNMQGLALDLEYLLLFVLTLAASF